MKFVGGIRKQYGEFTPLSYHAVVQQAVTSNPHTNSVFTWQSFFKLPDGTGKHHEEMWLAVTLCPSGGLESIVTVVCNSQLDTQLAASDANHLQISIMPLIDACIGSILLTADRILLEEATGAPRPNLVDGDTLFQTVDV
ncbi:unnamed protein product [Phytophthora lilii]|uniref:Unnamed protein product n=1 Tax=Phytophthora lilii TaxID=2077276 RepID=A0A9W6X2C2_9STRA|nr:unnamed protein product [Phytophthora lilii]